MKYMGSKNRIAKDILPIILQDRKPNQYYVEPFVGGANMIDKVTGLRIGADINEYLIEALLFIRDFPDCLPKDNTEFTEQDYADIRLNKDKNKPLTGFAGFAYSFGAKWFGGWARCKKNTDYISTGYRGALKQSPFIQGVDFRHSIYQDLEIPPNSIIYCDPPYRGTTGYKDKFDHDIFWQWCRDKSNEGHTVYISEYSAPEDFICVWEKEIISSLDNRTAANKATEKLYTYL
jgi:DNA adenine methylase